LSQLAEQAGAPTVVFCGAHQCVAWTQKHGVNARESPSRPLQLCPGTAAAPFQFGREFFTSLFQLLAQYASQPHEPSSPAATTASTYPAATPR
jgi:hypothetical protein